MTERHRLNSFQRPTGSGQQDLFHAIDRVRQSTNKPVMLDSGCGNGESTLRLAADNPDKLVIGIDKSTHRLQKHPLSGNIYHKDNLVLARANLVDFWRLAVRAGWQLDTHYLFYPNPWPKQKHLMRRWYAHPVLPALLRLGGALEIRSNWPVYIEEFASTLQSYDLHPIIKPVEVSGSPVSPFESKYAASGHTLFQLKTRLDKLVVNNQKTG